MSSPANTRYLGAAGAPQPQPSLLTWLWREQITNPAHREGNLSIARAVGIFAVGVIFIRSSWSSALVPVF